MRCSSRPTERTRIEADESDVCRVFAAMLDFAAEPVGSARERRLTGRSRASISLVARDPARHGLLCRCQGKPILIVSGTPAADGRRPRRAVARAGADCSAGGILYLVGGGDTLHSGQWFLDRMAEIDRRTRPHVPPRFLEECDALAAGGRRLAARRPLANLIPERFHCSGVALRGKATAGGRVLHARVLDYMRDIDLQEGAAVMVFLPEGATAG